MKKVPRLIRNSIIALLLCMHPVLAQPAADTLQQLLLPTVYEQVLSHHPVVRQAQLLGDIAQAEILLARGSFDPTLDIHWNQKILKGTTYYTNWNNFVKIPTWWGAEVKAGYEKYVGINVNPENFTPPEGLIYADVTVPIGRDLLFDARRNILRQAQLLPQLNEADRLKLVNKLLLQVAKDYWTWYYTYRAVDIYKLGRDVALRRFEFILQEVQIGEAAAIDTVEARLELLDREVMLAEAQVRYRNAALALSNHLWDESGTPLELQPNVVPLLDSLVARIPDGLDTLRQYAQASHPEIRKLEFKLLQLAYERSYQSQMRLPQMDVNIKPFLIPGNDPFASDRFYWSDNFKLGFNLYTPLLLRKERAKLQMTDIKVMSTQWELSATRRVVQIGVESAWNDLNNYVRLLRIQDMAVRYSGVLLQASEQKLEVGESSLFLVNSYERKLLKERVTMAELQGKYAKSLAEYYWNAGVPLSQLTY